MAKKDLQRIINECKKHPERYGSGEWWDTGHNPICPLAKLVLKVYKPSFEYGSNEAVIAASRLKLSVQTIEKFMNWWDGTDEMAEEDLIKLGYKI